jgi:hypothetical protein
MQVEPDGLYVTLNPTERGARVLAENPGLGVSARIVEQYQRADGKFFPAAIQHVLGTLDPRVTGLGAWTPLGDGGRRRFGHHDRLEFLLLRQGARPCPARPG